MAKTTVLCGICGYSAPRRKGDVVGRHYIYSAAGPYRCLGTGHTEAETQSPPLVGSRLREAVKGAY